MDPIQFSEDEPTRAGPSKIKNRNQEIRAINQKLAHRRAERAKEARRVGPMGLWGWMILDGLDAQIQKLEGRLCELGSKG